MPNYCVSNIIAGLGPTLFCLIISTPLRVRG